MKTKKQREVTSQDCIQTKKDREKSENVNKLLYSKSWWVSSKSVFVKHSLQSHTLGCVTSRAVLAILTNLFLVLTVYNW